MSHIRHATGFVRLSQGTFLPDYVAEELDIMQNDPAVADIQERTQVALGYLQMIRKIVSDEAQQAQGLLLLRALICTVAGVD